MLITFWIISNAYFYTYPLTYSFKRATTTPDCRHCNITYQCCVYGPCSKHSCGRAAELARSVNERKNFLMYFFKFPLGRKINLVEGPRSH